MQLLIFRGPYLFDGIEDLEPLLVNAKFGSTLET